MFERNNVFSVLDVGHVEIRKMEMIILNNEDLR
jgi:hypothetical protein